MEKTLELRHGYYAVDVRPMEEAPSQVHLLDLRTNQWSTLVHKPNFRAKHEQFSRDNHAAWRGQISSIFFSTGLGKAHKGNLWIGRVGDESSPGLRRTRQTLRPYQRIAGWEVLDRRH